MLKLEKIRQVQNTGYLVKSRDLQWDGKRFPATKVSHRVRVEEPEEEVKD